jgi:NAD(P)H-nitrite reductase large subunit
LVTEWPRLLVDELTRCAHGRHAIALIGDEPRLTYNRVLLSSVLVRNRAGGYRA